MKILIVKLSAIGDVIHTLPALNALRRTFPEAHITWLVEEPASEIVTSHPAVDRVLVSDRKRWLRGLRSPGRWENLRQISGFLRTLRDTSYDVVIDFQGLLKSAVLIRWARGKRKIGYNKSRECSYLALNERVPPFDMDKHAVFRYLHLVEGLSVNVESVTFDIPFGEEETHYVTSILRQSGWTGEPVIAINPVAKWKAKLWPAENFSRLADRLRDECEVFVVFTGAAADRKEISRIRAAMRHDCADQSGRTGLKQLAALYALSSCLVTPDTGPMHLAAAVGTPVVALFGPTAPWRTGPFGECHEVIRAGLSCSPCFKRSCDTARCMDDLSPEEAFAAVRRVMERSRGEGADG
jgi:heptosyltransferase-1